MVKVEVGKSISTLLQNSQKCLRVGDNYVPIVICGVKKMVKRGQVPGRFLFPDRSDVNCDKLIIEWLSTEMEKAMGGAVWGGRSGILYVHLLMHLFFFSHLIIIKCPL